MTERAFHIGDILSVTTGKLLSPRLIGGVYDILNFMTGESLFTHQLPRACDAAKPSILQQHPQLTDANVDGITRENWLERLEKLAQQFGETLPIAPLEVGKYSPRNPIEELAELVGPESVIVVNLDTAND